MTAPAQHPGWAELVRAALVGTARGGAQAWRALPPDEPAAPLVARLPTSDAAAELLAAAALVGTYAAAARLPGRAPDVPDEPATPDAADLPPAPPAAAQHLWTMLAGTHVEVLPEWCRAAAAGGWRAPSFALPALLSAAARTPALRGPVAGVLGARGRWLAGRNPEWAWAVVDARAVPDDAGARAGWETGAPDERRALLGRVRRSDAARGRALLESTWAEEPPGQRAAFLACLEEGLGPGDEPFLERALDDRRQEVRRAAVALLATLPESALVARMTDRARPALRYQPGRLLRAARLEVVPPAAHDTAMARDGVEAKAPAGIGERAWWLAQILAAVPPRVWCDAWGVTAGALVRLAAEGEWARPLLDGWAAAAVRHRDAAWVEALLRVTPPGSHVTPVAPVPARLLGVLPPERQEAVIADLLRERGGDRVLLDLLLAVRYPWSEEFARVVLDRLRRRATAGILADPAEEWRVRELLPNLAVRVPTALTTATAGWPADGSRGAPWAPSVERFVTLFTFRRELMESFDR